RLKFDYPTLKISSRGTYEPVAGARLRQEKTRTGRIGLNLAPKLRDVDVEVVRLAPVVWPPDLAQDHRMRQQLPFVSDEQTQQIELGRGEREWLAGALHKLAVPIGGEV